MGTDGTVLNSIDGKTWSLVNLGVVVDIQSVTYGNSRFIAVGNSGTVLTSPEGLNWTISNLDITTDLLSITYGNGRYIAVGRSSAIQLSIDGANWKMQKVEISGTLNSINSIIYGKGQFLAVGILASSRAISVTLTSVDGINWNNTRITSTLLHSVTYGDNQFVAVGDGIKGREESPILTSTDGTNWISQDVGLTYGLKSVTYGDNKFVTVGDAGMILTSSAENSEAIRPSMEKSHSTRIKIIYGLRYYSASFPNVTIQEEINIKLHNIKGRIIYSTTMKSTNGVLKIPVTGLEAGIYFLTLTNSKTGYATSFMLVE